MNWVADTTKPPPRKLVDGFWACILTHAIQLQNGHIDGHEVFEDAAVDRGCTSQEDFAASEPEPLSHLLEHQDVSNGPSPRHRLPRGIQVR